VVDPCALPGAPEPDATIDFEGREVRVSSRDTVGVALLRQGEWILSRSVKYHRPRGLFCLDQGCAGCLMRIGGEPNQFACTSPCRDGLAVSRQNAFPSAGRDVLRAIDWAYPGGLNHHEMFAGVPVAETVMAKVARQLAGFGELPDANKSIAKATVQTTSVCVLGMGRAGAAARARLVERGVDAAGIDRTTEAGSGREAVGVYRDGSGLAVVARGEGGLSVVRPRALLVCTGSRDQTLCFAGNDRPGVFTAWAMLQLIERHRVLPSNRLLVAGDGPTAAKVARVGREAGAEVRVVESGVSIVRARGSRHLQGLDLLHPDGHTEVWTGGAMAACGPRVPVFELGAEAGAGTVPRPAGGFALAVDPNGGTRVADVFAAGSCSDGAGDSTEQGRRVADAVAHATTRIAP
jgi:sarcosine oxidase subunit alpha